jgi:hypothetical protein
MANAEKTDQHKQHQAKPQNTRWQATNNKIEQQRTKTKRPKREYRNKKEEKPERTIMKLPSSTTTCIAAHGLHAPARVARCNGTCGRVS